MKLGILFFLSALLLIPFDVFAQNINREIRQASREVNRYNLEPMENKENLLQAKEIIDGLIELPEARDNFSIWQTRADVYNASIAAEMTLIQLEQIREYSSPEDAMIAFEAIKKAVPLADSRGEERDLLRSLNETVVNLGNVANQYIDREEYDKAFGPLEGIYRIHHILLDLGEDAVFDSEADENSHLFITAICGMQAGKVEKAKEYMMMLYEREYEEARVYVTLFNLYLDKDEERALEFLEAGKEVAPDDIDLLYAEINYYISKNDFRMLQEKLAIAVEKDPENTALYNVLGNVFMNLMTEALEEDEDEEVVDQYFKTALKYLETATELDPDYYEPYYTIGSIYFNQAAIITQRINELGMTREDQKLYEEYTAEANALFDKALPYFKKAESMEPNDINTLIALRETFARLQDFELYNEFNERIEKIDAGEKIRESYFNE